MKTNIDYRIKLTRRTGASTLEFVFALPILSALMVVLSWTGFSLLNKSQATVESRHVAWQKRHNNDNQKPFVFGTNPLYKATNDFVIGNVKKTVSVAKVHDQQPDPESSHVVMAGTWDHSVFQLDGLPNWKKYGQALANAKTGELQNLAGGIRNFQNILNDAAANYLRNQFSLDSLLNPPSVNTSNQQTAQKNAQAQEKAAEYQKLVEERTEIYPELRQLRGIKQLLNDDQKRKLARLEIRMDAIDLKISEMNSAEELPVDIPNDNPGASQ